MSIATTILADAGFSGDHMNGWGGGWMWLWGVAMMGVFVGLVVWLVRASTGSSGISTGAAQGPRDTSERGREILAERFANGEITTEEYRERLSELQ